MNQQTTSMKKFLLLTIAITSSALLVASAGDAKETYEKTCAKCHGTDGKGQTKMGAKLAIKDYTDAKVQAGFTDEEAFKALKEGLKDKEDKILMKPVEALSDDEIKALVAHVRTLKK
jgi:cytochrome c553